MPKSKNTNYNLLNDALLEMSENDERLSKELLKLAGADPDKLVNTSMKMISKHRQALKTKLTEEHQRDDLFETVQAKIFSMFSKSPEKTRSFLSGYFEQHSMPIQFGTQAGLDTNDLSKYKEELDLEDLSRKLDDNDSH